MTITKEEALVFINKKIGVLSEDKNSQTGEGYVSGFLIRVTDNALLLNSYGRLVWIDLNTVKKIKEKRIENE